MNCKTCGASLSSDQKFCPSCGTAVGSNGIGNIENLTVPSEVPSSFNNQQSGVNVNISSANDIGFKRDDQSDLEQLSSSNPFSNRAGTMSKENLIEQMSQGFGSMNVTTTNKMTMENMNIPESGQKKKFPWIALAIGLVIVMVVGIIGVPLLNNLKKSVYETDDYKLEYSANWSVSEDDDKMILYYSDKESRFMLNSVATYTSLKFTIDDDNDKKVLYNAFYNAWQGLEGGKLTGGTETFLDLTDDVIYARIDYEVVGKENIGSFFVVVNQNKDKVISFLTYCDKDSFDKINKDVMKMLESITYKTEADSSAYDKFNPGTTKDYTAVGYMDYKMPESWTLDEERTKGVSYKSNIFKFRDGQSILDVKGVTPYDATALKYGTTYESMKAAIVRNYGAVKEEKTKTINGKVWYVIITPDYVSAGKSYHNEIYFTLSASNTHLYYLEAYVSNDTSKNKTSFFNESIDYILESAKLYKVEE